MSAATWVGLGLFVAVAALFVLGPALSGPWPRTSTYDCAGCNRRTRFRGHSVRAWRRGDTLYCRHCQRQRTGELGRKDGRSPAAPGRGTAVFAFLLLLAFGMLAWWLR